MTNRVLFLSKGEQSASTRYRALNYFTGLAEQGWEAIHLTADNDAHPIQKINILRAAAKADAVVVIRRTFSYPFLWLLRRFAKRMVFDFDDAIFCKSDGSPSRSRMNRFRRMAMSCDAIWAGNDYLAASAAPFAKNISVMPTSVDFSIYNQIASKPEDCIDCVWIGSSSTRRYLDGLIPLLDDIASQHPQLRLKIVADFTPDTTHVPVNIIPWSESAEAVALASAHIGIAPMVENNWTAGKCGLKVIQYMAAGLPVITDTAGVNKHIVADGITGFVAKSPQDWQNAIVKLMENPPLRSRMGEQGRANAERKYDLQITLHKIVSSLNKLK